MEANDSNDGHVLDGYRLIRFLGRGGFGEVWLCMSEAMGDYRAIKMIPTTSRELLEKEYNSLVHYRKAAARLRSPHLVPIEHINRNEEGLYYVMPLADGLSAHDPSDPSWQPHSLTVRIYAQAAKSTWFSSREITALLLPILQALQTLSEAGLVHRDVKPENILFFNGLPCLGDISLLGADASQITRRGTPGYATPSWYAGGHPDMFGIAATLYTLLTGNSPDKMGRAAFLWPPQGEASLGEAERAEWKRLHAVIRRATDEKVSERFVDFAAMACGLSGKTARPKSKLPLMLVSTLAAVSLLAGTWVWHISRYSHPASVSSTSHSNKPIVPGETGQNDEKQEPDQTPVSNELTTRWQDARMADGSLVSSIQRYFGTTPLEMEEYRVLLEARNHISNCVVSPSSLDCALAVRYLDNALAACPNLTKRPNVMLARLLLLQCAGENDQVRTGIDNPDFLELGKDDLGFRVTLLNRLHAGGKAEQILTGLIDAKTSPGDTKMKALRERVKLRVKLGMFAEANVDYAQAETLAENNPTIISNLQADRLALEKEVPGYAAYLKTRTVK